MTKNESALSHSGIGQSTLYDDPVRYLSYSIDEDVFQALCCKRGGEVVGNF
ncbi:MAG: hypothetical protein KDA52_07065 [Planctomycetaceae bacterium]|nr:hypothetical protein [Planctomycetaceae bacterium]